jgi:hypothetical protein
LSKNNSCRFVIPRPRAVLALVVAVLVAAGAALVTLRRDRARTGSPPAAAPAPVTTGTGPLSSGPEPAGPDRCRGILLRTALAGGSAGPDRAPRTLEAVARSVEEVRGLRFRRLPSPTYLPRREVAARAARFVDEYPPEREDLDETALVALGTLPAGTDLRSTLSRALGDQVVGFYDDDSGELVVASDRGRDLDPEAAVTLAHELEHALADQNFELPGGDVPPPGREDAAAAESALVEGDATLTMQLWALRNLALRDQLELGATADRGVFETLPDFVQRSLLFPYTEGLGFVCARYETGGWAAVDAAYRDPPDTTAEILFPERYGRAEPPVEPPAPPAPGPGWQALGHAALGAADLWFLFQAPGGDPRRALDHPRARAGAWAGGRVDVWTRGKERVVAVTLAERPGAPPLCESVRTFATRAGLAGATVTCSPGRALLSATAPANSRQ